MTTEPSTFALDVYFADNCPADSPIAAHVASCLRCRAYLGELAARAGENAAQAPAAAPLAASNRRPRVTWSKWTAPAAGALALAAGVLLYLRGAGTSPHGYVGTKGTPAVELLVHRDDDTRVWDGRTPVHPGDSLALRVACEGLTQVTVAAPATAARTGLARLSDAPCPAAGDALPFTLKVDDEPGDENLAVILGESSLDDDALAAAIHRQERSGTTWVVTFHLPKTSAAR